MTRLVYGKSYKRFTRTNWVFRTPCTTHQLVLHRTEEQNLGCGRSPKHPVRAYKSLKTFTSCSMGNTKHVKAIFNLKAECGRHFHAPEHLRPQNFEISKRAKCGNLRFYGSRKSLRECAFRLKTALTCFLSVIAQQDTVFNDFIDTD